jgi:7-cyano-7-deazaguanine synthase
MMTKSKVVHLLSGGMDSVVLLYELVGDGCMVYCVLFDYGQVHKQELDWARLHCQRLGALFEVLTLPRLRGSTLTDGSGGVIVPVRNAAMLTVAVNVAAAAGAELVTFAANKDDDAGFPDCRRGFVMAFNNMLATCDIRVQVATPYWDKTKAWIARRGSDMGVVLSQTWSCYRGGEAPCGECEACRKREEALR